MPLAGAKAALFRQEGQQQRRYPREDVSLKQAVLLKQAVSSDISMPANSSAQCAIEGRSSTKHHVSRLRGTLSGIGERREGIKLRQACQLGTSPMISLSTPSSPFLIPFQRASSLSHYRHL